MKANNSFCIFSAGRSGSHLLKSLLESHPAINCEGEIFHPTPHPPNQEWIYGNYSFLVKSSRWAQLAQRIAPLTLLNIYWEQLYSRLKHKTNKPVLGFLAWYRDTNNYPEILRWIHRYRVKVIHLVRINQLKSLVSLAIANRTKTFLSTHPVAPTPVRLNPKRILSELEQRDHQIANFRLHSTQIPYLEVTYESLTNDREQTLTRILKFLGQDRSYSLETHLTKINSDRLPEIITNYAEVCATLQGTRFENFLENGH